MRYRYTSGLSAALLISSLTLTGFADDPDPYAQCWENYEYETEICNDTFHQSGSGWDNVDAHAACLTGAELNLAACMDGLDQALYQAAWNRFINRLKDCVTENVDNPAGEFSCISAAIMVYRQEIEDLRSSGNDCGPYAGNFAQVVGPMYALEAAARQLGYDNGQYPVSVNTSLTFMAGVNATLDASYDVAQMPCIKSALAIAIYATKTGAEVVVFDADTNAANGVFFDMHLIGSDLIDADEIVLISMFYDARAVPQFAEIGTLEIQDSPISGDWNRDEVLNTQDVIDFLDSYNAQAKRADITNDGIVDPADAVEFTEDYTE